MAEKPARCLTVPTPVAHRPWRTPALVSPAAIDWAADPDPEHAADLALPRDTGVFALDIAAAAPVDVRIHDDGFAAAVLNAQPHLVWTTGRDGETEYRNLRWHDFAGDQGGGDARTATRWTAILHPAEQAPAWARWQQHLASGEAYEAEHRLRRHDGDYRWALARVVAVRGPDGAILRWCGTLTDIETLKANATQLDFLACELTHRIGNIFAVVESMLMLSARGQPAVQAFAEDACARIQALGQANAYIRPQHGSDAHDRGRASLQGLMDTLLAPYGPGAGEQTPATSIVIEGPDVGIGTAAATLLALVIHELATNAAKYGALARAGGELRVTTAVTDGMLHLVWRETGGPALAGPPARRGFGTILTDRALRLPLAARVERSWDASGLTVSITVPCANLVN